MRQQDMRQEESEWLLGDNLQGVLRPSGTQMPYIDLVLQGERDYRELKGQTGPLVYPAGFVYVFAFLHKVTRGGGIAAGQAAFTAVYLVAQAVVLWLYVKAQVRSLRSLCMRCRCHSAVT